MANEDTYGPPPEEVHPKIANLRGKHRAAHPDGRSTLNVESHALTVSDWPIRCDRFKAALKLVGIHCIKPLGFLKLDHHLLTALVERWSPQTNTFHLSVGEMTITLEDVAMILGLHIDGPPVIGEPVVGAGRRWQTWPDCCDDLLGTHPDPNALYNDPLNEGVTVKFRMGQARAQTCLPLRWIRWIFRRESYADLDEITFQRHVRAYILFVIGSFLLPDTSGNEVHLQYLPLLEDLVFFSKLSLGGAVLANVYRELAEATNPKRTRISGCVHLIQVWSWEHLHIGRPTLNVPIPDEMFGYSVGLRWNCNWTREVPLSNVQCYRDEFDGLLESQVIWEPYTPRIRLHISEICSSGAAIWMARVPLISWKRVEWYFPDRVLRQFGCLPRINVEPMERTFHRIDGRGKPDTNWTVYHGRYIDLWDNRHMSMVEFQRPYEESFKERAIKTYMRWYKSWASLYLLKAPAEPPQSYYPRAATERELRELIQSTERMFQPFFDNTSTSEQQLVINAYRDKMIAAKKKMFIADTTYIDTADQMGAGPSSQTVHDEANVGPSSYPGQSQTPMQPFFQYASAAPSSYFPTPQQHQYGEGVTSQFQQWPGVEMNWTQASTSTSTPQPIFFQSPTWATTRPSENVSEQPQEEQRPRKRPDKYTPGSGAIPKKKGNKKK